MAGTGYDARERTWPRPDLLVSLAAIVVAVALSIGLSSIGRRVLDTASTAALSYLFYWIPLLAAAAIVRARRWDGAHPIAWRLTPLDVLWGLGVGLLLRAAAASFEFVIRGTVVAPTISTTGSTTAETLSFIAITVVAPLLLAPVVEELFFRGTLLTSLRPPGRGIGMTAVAVVLSAAIFALPHVVGASSLGNGLVAFAGAAVLGLGSGALAVATQRVGASIVAHVTFNAALLLLLVV